MEPYNWKSIDELFGKLNKSCSYLILRNYECMNQEDIFTKGHEDIDFLCLDRRQMVTMLDARPRHSYDNQVQYYILLDGQKVKIDLRHAGDGYYDPAWQREMLQNRQLHSFGFYVMNEEDYFYSLIYHSILQKKKLSEDYRLRLEQMARDRGLSGHSEGDFIRLLEQFMDEKGYVYSYPKDCTVPNRFKLIDSTRKTGHGIWYLHKLRHLPVQTVNYIRHKVGG